MARVFLISIFLLILPFFLYGGYATYVRRNGGTFSWDDAPIVWLALAGVVLAVGGLIGLVSLTGI